MSTLVTNRGQHPYKHSANESRYSKSGWAGITDVKGALDDLKDHPGGGGSTVTSGITNDSSVSGATAKDALNTLQTEITAIPSSYAASAITNDSSVTGAHVSDALNTLLGDMVFPAGTRLMYVDGDRSDTYTPDGSFARPFKTIQAANDACPPETVGNLYGIIVDRNNGNYIENLNLTHAKFLVTFNEARINGNVTLAGTSTIKVKGFDFVSTVNMTNTQGIDFDDVQFLGTITHATGAGPVVGRSCLFTTSSGSAIVKNSTAQLSLFETSIVAGNVVAVSHTAGLFTMSNCSVTNNSVGSYAITSSAGQVLINNTLVKNSAGTLSMNLDNGATTSPNILTDVIAVGNVSCGSAVTIVDGITLPVGTLSGAAIAYRPASRLTNDSSVTGATVKNALDTLNTGLTTANTNMLAQRPILYAATGAQLDTALIALRAIGGGEVKLTADISYAPAANRDISNIKIVGSTNGIAMVKLTLTNNNYMYGTWFELESFGIDPKDASNAPFRITASSAFLRIARLQHRGVPTESAIDFGGFAAYVWAEEIVSCNLTNSGSVSLYAYNGSAVTFKTGGGGATVDSSSTVTGATSITYQSTASKEANDSSVAGATVKDALNTLGTGLTGTLTLDDGSHWRVTQTFTNGRLTAQTTGASSGATATFA